MQNAQELLESGRKALEKGDFAYAKDCFASLQEIGAKQKSAIITLLANDGLGRTYAAMQDNAQAKKYFTLALMSAISKFGAEHLQTASCKQNLAKILSCLGEDAEAILYGESALAIIEAQEPNRLPHAHCLLATSSLYYRTKDFTRVGSLLKQALEIFESLLGRKSFEVSICLNNFGRLFEELGKPEEGIGYHQESVAIRTEVLGCHPETAFSLANLGSACAEAGHLNEAICALQSAINMYESLGMGKLADAVACQNNLQQCKGWLADKVTTV